MSPTLFIGSTGAPSGGFQQFSSNFSNDNEERQESSFGGGFDDAAPAENSRGENFRGRGSRGRGAPRGRGGGYNR